MIQAHSISKAFGGITLLEDVSFVINEKDKIGIIGPNGTGKSTLLRMIAGLENPDKGTIKRNDEEIGLLSQTLPYEKDETIYSFLRKSISEDWEEYKMDIACAQVGLDMDYSTRIANLSGGQKTRLGLARVLIEDVTTLLLDEPTNNLDLESITWLEKCIPSFSGTVVTISHDRTFLDNTVQTIYELDFFNHSLKKYRGNYSQYEEAKKNEYEKQMASYTNFTKKKRKMEDWIHKKTEQVSYHASAKVGRQLQAMKTRFEREISENAINKPQTNPTIKIPVQETDLYRKRVIFSIRDTKYKHIFSCQSLTICAGDRIRLHGNNGSGKTTTLSILLGELRGYSGRVEKASDIKIGYFSQDNDLLQQGSTVIDIFIDKTDIGNETDARKVLGAYNITGSLVFSPVERLSPGQRVKLVIAILNTTDNSFFVLDEPTNHLDIESRVVLEEALEQYTGGFILVSHDRSFVNAVRINRNFEIKNGILSEKFI